MSVKMTKQHIFIIENNLQKVGQSFFSLVPSDNRDTRSTCPTSVFIGIRQTLMSRPGVCAPLITGGSCRTKHTWKSTKTILNYFRFRNPVLTILKEAINVGLKLCSNICHSDF